MGVVVESVALAAILVSIEDPDLATRFAHSARRDPAVVRAALDLMEDDDRIDVLVNRNLVASARQPTHIHLDHPLPVLPGETEQKSVPWLQVHVTPAADREAAFDVRLTLEPVEGRTHPPLEIETSLTADGAMVPLAPPEAPGVLLLAQAVVTDDAAGRFASWDAARDRILAVQRAATPRARRKAAEALLDPQPPAPTVAGPSPSAPASGP